MSQADKFPESKFFYIPNALNLDELLKIRRSVDHNIACPKILYLGHIGREKGIYELVESARLLKGAKTIFHMDIIGETLGPGELDEIKQVVIDAGLGEEVQFWPYETGEAKLKRLVQADIYVLPSYHEGMPNAIIEAMAASLPVIATTVGGIPDMIESGVSGILIPSKNVDSLVDALKLLISNSSLRYQLGGKAREFAREFFAIETKVKNLCILYKLLID